MQVLNVESKLALFGSTFSGNVVCKVCNKSLTDGGGTSNLQNHQRRKHLHNVL